MGRWRSGSADNAVLVGNLVVAGITTPTATNVSNPHCYSNYIDWSKRIHSGDVITSVSACSPSGGRLCTSAAFPEGCSTNSALRPLSPNRTKLKYPFDEYLAQETIQDDENLFWDINLTDPLMTDAIYEAEDMIFTHSTLLKQLDVNQCSLCSTPYVMQHTGFLSDTSPTICADTVGPMNSHSTSPTLSSSSAMSDPSPLPMDTCRKRKPKFFRSSRFSHSLEYEQDNRRYPLVRGTGLTKRWTPRCGQAFLRNGKRSKADNKPISCHAQTISTDSMDSVRPHFFPNEAYASSEHMVCNSHSLPITDEEYTSGITSAPTIDPSPYAFDASPTLKHKSSHQPNFRPGAHFRSTGGHGPKRLHLLQFILKLLREPSEKKETCEKYQSSVPEGELGEDSSECNSSVACVEWVDEGERTFTIKNPFRLAQLWGMYKNNWNMTFESLCRSLRLYYVSGKLERIRGQRNQYRLLGPHR
ncbi:ETS homologous factor [Clonorchis sinensis]|uniref:ETS homologous factor n=1 Tax=Clonorchis sinensis TaxID=79923 RepID=G7YSN0_CLOSI|nr:ETS homologous factor [Clonorchis sinensis]